jgi:hypothetical protein
MFETERSRCSLAGPRTMTSDEPDGLAFWARSRLISKSSAWTLSQLTSNSPSLFLTVWNAALYHQHTPTLVVHASTTATGATIIALSASPLLSYLRRALRTLSPITTPAPKYREAMSCLQLRVKTIRWSPPLPPHPCVVYAIPCQTSHTSMVPVSHHHPYPSIPVRSTAHAHALSPSRPSYPPSLGSTQNVIALSAHAVEHPLRPLFYDLAAATTTSRRVHHTSPAAGMMVVRRLNPRPSGLIGNSCSA